MRIFKLLIILIYLCSCSTSKSVVGLYGKCSEGYFVCHQFQLNADSTFEYFRFYDVGGAMVLKGTWERSSNDTIIINTFKQPEIPKTTFIGEINSNRAGKVTIQISDINGPVIATKIFINDRKQHDFANKEGIVEFQTDSVYNIEYEFLDQREILEIENPKYNQINILIKDLDSGSEYLTNEKLVLNRNRILMGSNLVFKRTRMENKVW